MNHGYTPRNEPASLTFMNLPAGGIGADLTRSYQWDFRGRLRKRETGSDIPRTFSYDSIGQITAFADSMVVGYNMVCPDPWDLTNCTNEPVWDQVGGGTYTWDAVGNPTGSGITTEKGNRLRQYDGWAMTYDLEGNVVSRQKGSVTQTLTWNALGQLASVTSGGQTISYGYDGFGRRVSSNGRYERSAVRLQRERPDAGAGRQREPAARVQLLRRDRPSPRGTLAPSRDTWGRTTTRWKCPAT
jgi:YD repeat-containing protein